MTHRPGLNKSDQSAHPTASSVRNAGLAEQFISATDLEVLSGSEILERSLNLRSVISTASSFSKCFQRARYHPELKDINEIGIGLQGVVFEQVGEACAFKKEKPGNEHRPTNLYHEYGIHLAVSAAFNKYRDLTKTRTEVPRPLEFLSKSTSHASAFWDSVLPKIPAEHCTPGDIMKMDRILPLPKVVRQGLIAHLCGQERYTETPETSRLLNSQQNKHCLARVYLGRKTGPYDTITPLRNFPLYLNTMQSIGLDTITLATELGIAYAILHWGACVDGDDVEFVFGSSALEQNENPDKPDLQHRATGLYLLDFGQCQMVDLHQDPEIVYQAFKGAMVTGDNQSFIPRFDGHPQLFAAFRTGYIAAGNLILSEKQLTGVFNIEEFFRGYEEYAEDFL